MKYNMLKVNNILYKTFLELFILNKKKRSILKARWAKKHLKPYIENSLGNKYTKSLPKQKLDENNIIWQYWHQGKENAPLLIQKCFESIEKFENDKKIVVLSFETIKDYVDLPQRYYDLVNSKKMSIAHFSDILRVYLLEQYGGIWIDSTIYLTDKIPDEIYNSDFCVTQKNPNKDLQENKMSCFFIHAKKESQNIIAIKQILDNYWSKNNFALNYFMFEHIATMLSNYNKELKEEWNKMPYISAEDCGALQKIINTDFNDNSWNKITSENFMHKLTYKIEAGQNFLNKI